MIDAGQLSPPVKHSGGIDTTIRVYGPDGNWPPGVGCEVTTAASALCPDLLSLDNIGEADNLRGRVVRAFFRLMRPWPTS